MNETTQLAYVLHSRPYREKQLLVDLLTENDGKLGALSFISYSGKSARKAMLQPFYPIMVTLKGQQNLKHIVRVEPASKSFSLNQNFLYSAFYINELLVKLLGENIPCESLFSHYQDSLIALSAKEPIEQILRSFELALLDELGVSFDFSQVYGDENKMFLYHPEQGFVAAELQTKKIIYSREHLQAIAQHDFSEPEVLSTFKVLMRQVFNHLLGGVPLNSRKLFKKQRP